MTERTDQQVCIKFCFNLGKSCTETIEMIQKAFADESMSITQIKERYRRFKNGQKHVKVGAMSSQCWLFFSIVRVLCTTNLLQEVRRSTKNIKLKFWKDSVMAWEENNRVSGQAVTGFFTTITRQRIHRTLCTNFWRNIRLYSFASLRTVPT